MMKTIINKYDKHKIGSLPQVLFPGRIFVIQDEREAEKAVDYLLSCDILGVDTETKPSFKKGHMHKVALLQVSTKDTCFLFRLNYIGLPPSLIRLLSNTSVPMIGLSWHDDICSLHRRCDFKPGLFIDIQNLVPKLGVEDLSLQKLYANIFGQKISKRQRLTNWEADVLNEAQKRYAATDAWACINLYQEIVRMEAEHDYELEIAPEEPKEPKEPKEPEEPKEPREPNEANEAKDQEAPKEEPSGDGDGQTGTEVKPKQAKPSKPRRKTVARRGARRSGQSKPKPEPEKAKQA